MYGFSFHNVTLMLYSSLKLLQIIHYICPVSVYTRREYSLSKWLALQLLPTLRNYSTVRFSRKSNIINEAWGLLSANLSLPLSVDYQWWVTLPSTLMGSMLESARQAEMKRVECCERRSEERASRFTHFSLPLPLLLVFLNSLPHSLFRCFSNCLFKFVRHLTFSQFLWLIISLFPQTLSQCNKATWHLEQQIP